MKWFSSLCLGFSLSLGLLHGQIQAPIQVQAGASASNAWVGGRITMVHESKTNCCAGGVLTNLSSFTMGGNLLTNAGDTVWLQASGRYSSVGQRKRLVLTYGSTNLLDTGLLPVSNDTWMVWGHISRRMEGGQYYVLRASWNRGVSGGGTNVSGVVFQTNGIPTLLRMQGAANAVSCITNDAFMADYYPGPR